MAREVPTARPPRVMRVFLYALLAGAALALVVLGLTPLAKNPLIPAVVERNAQGSLVERWHSGTDDRLAATSAEGAHFPQGIAALAEPRLANTTAATMKIRDAHDTVVAVASRFTAPELDGRVATWWTFVVAARGTFAAYVPDSTTGVGRILGGTRDFENAVGEFVEERRTDGTYTLRLVRRPPGASP